MRSVRWNAVAAFAGAAFFPLAFVFPEFAATIDGVDDAAGAVVVLEVVVGGAGITVVVAPAPGVGVTAGCAATYIDLVERQHLHFEGRAVRRRAPHPA